MNILKTVFMTQALVAVVPVSLGALALPSVGQASTVGYYAITDIGSTTCVGSVTPSPDAASAFCERSNVDASGFTPTNTVILESRADPGSIGTRTSLTNTGPTNTGWLTARAGIRDTLTFGIQDGVMELVLDIAGSANFGAIESGTSRARIFVTTIAGTAFQRDEILPSVEGTVRPTPDSSSIGEFGLTTVSLAFTQGSLFLAADMTNQISCGVTLIGGPCEIGADYFSSVRLVGARVFDADGNENFASIGSALGVDYRTGVEPHDAPTAPIPLPAAGWLLLGGLGALAAMRRRKPAA